MFELREDETLAGLSGRDVARHPYIEMVIDLLLGGGGPIKAAVVDRRQVYIGSMNLDPRSMELNSEVGALIESPALAEDLARLIERGMASENSWRLGVDHRGDLQWVSSSNVLRRQPARSVWQRLQDWFFMIFPSSLY